MIIVIPEIILSADSISKILLFPVKSSQFYSFSITSHPIASHLQYIQPHPAIIYSVFPSFRHPSRSRCSKLECKNRIKFIFLFHPFASS